MLGAQNLVSHMLTMLAESQTSPEFKVPKRTSISIVHNRTDQGIVATLEIESDAPGSVHSGTTKRLAFGQGNCVACVSLAPGEDLRVEAGEEEVDVQVRAIVLVPL
jgi:hypothetical protein